MRHEGPAGGRPPRLRAGRPRGEALGHRALTESEWIGEFGELALPPGESVDLRAPAGQALALLIVARLVGTGRLGWLRAAQVLKALALARDADNIARAERELRERREYLERLIKARTTGQEEWADAVDPQTRQ